MATPTLLLPGEQIPSHLIPNPSSSTTLKIGPGLRYTPPSSITTTISGTLSTDARKNSIWTESNGQGRYLPAVNDVVIATVHHSSTDAFHCALSPYTTHATLPQLAFENVSRKTRPQLHMGSLVYARISAASKHMDPDIECVQPSGKAEGLGELKGGMVFDVSLGMARRLLLPRGKEKEGEKGGGGKVVVLEEFGEKHGVRFEVAVGRNGRVWVDSESVRSTIAIGRALRETDERGLTVAEQEKLVRNAVKSYDARNTT